MKVESESYGTTPEGRKFRLFTLSNEHGLKAGLSDFGATLVSLHVPDRQGKLADVTHGYDTLDGWMADKAYMGATVGRFGNRIAKGRFTLDGHTYQLATNNGPNHLHGGVKGFNKHLWEAQPGESQVEFRRVSPDGEENYPGTLTARVTYTLTNANELRIEFHATTDKPTIVNLVHHTYWNLTGDPRRTILDHELTLPADSYVPVGEDLIPTGKLAPVAGTPMDFNTPTAIGKRIAQVPGGYDHCWVLRGAVSLHDPVSGRFMEISTDQPGIQFYSGNFLDGSIRGKSGIKYQRHTGLCLETERFPDAPNQPAFPSAVVRPGDTYTHTMVHRFSVR